MLAFVVSQNKQKKNISSELYAEHYSFSLKESPCDHFLCEILFVISDHQVEETLDGFEKHFSSW